MLLCKSLDPAAKLPTVTHSGEDLAYDLYALEETLLYPGIVKQVRTGVAARFVDDQIRATFLVTQITKLVKNRLK